MSEDGATTCTLSKYQQTSSGTPTTHILSLRWNKISVSLAARAHTWFDKKSIPRLRELAPRPETGSRGLRNELLPDPAFLKLCILTLFDSAVLFIFVLECWLTFFFHFFMSVIKMSANLFMNKVTSFLWKKKGDKYRFLRFFASSY